MSPPTSIGCNRHLKTPKTATAERPQRESAYGKLCSEREQQGREQLDRSSAAASTKQNEANHDDRSKERVDKCNRCVASTLGVCKRGDDRRQNREGVSRPLSCGPSRSATAVRTTLMAVASNLQQKIPTRALNRRRRDVDGRQRSTSNNRRDEEADETDDERGE